MTDYPYVTGPVDRRLADQALNSQGPPHLVLEFSRFAKGSAAESRGNWSTGMSITNKNQKEDV